MLQSQINLKTVHTTVRFVSKFTSPLTGAVVVAGTQALIVGYVPATGIAGYYPSKTPVVLIDDPKALPLSVHEKYLEFV
jgi:hypothetical protein